MNMNINKQTEIIGIGFSNYINKSFKSSEELVFEAVNNSLKDTGLDFNDIDCFIFCENINQQHMNYILPDKKQRNLGLINKIGKCSDFKNKSIYKTSKDGLYGLYNGHLMISCGLFNIVMVVGIGNPLKENFDFLVEDIINSESAGKINTYFIAGLEMKKYFVLSGSNNEECAEVIISAKQKALNNDRAGFGSNLTKAQVLNSEIISEPLTSMDISPSLNASVSLILSAKGFTKNSDTINIDNLCWFEDKLESILTDSKIGYPVYLKEVFEEVYKNTGIKKVYSDIDFFEIEDSYSFQLLQSLELAGLPLREKPFDVFMQTKNKINPSGGCFGMGNPFEAKGLMKTAEAALQLREKAGSNQVKLFSGRALVEVHTPLPHRMAGVIMLGRLG